MAGCQNVDDTESSEDISEDISDLVDDQTILSESNTADNESGDNNMANEGVSSEESGQNKYTIEGFAFADGMEKPVCVTLSVENMQRGEEAYEKLTELLVFVGFEQTVRFDIN